MTFRECAESYKINLSTLYEWKRKGWIKATVDELGILHIDEKTLPCIRVKDHRGYDTSFYTIHYLERIYKYVSEIGDDIYDRDMESIRLLCSRGCEHIHRLRDCNYD